MGLTVFVDKIRPVVRVLQWFLTPTETVEFACGPLITFEAEEFRREGVTFVRQHFKQYKTRRLRREEIVPVFVTRSERNLLENQRAVRVQIVDDPPDTLVFTPLEIRKRSLNGLFPLPAETERNLTPHAKPAAFWKAFNEALAATD